MKKTINSLNVQKYFRLSQEYDIPDLIEFYLPYIPSDFRPETIYLYYELAIEFKLETLQAMIIEYLKYNFLEAKRSPDWNKFDTSIRMEVLEFYTCKLGEQMLNLTTKPGKICCFNEILLWFKYGNTVSKLSGTL